MEERKDLLNGLEIQSYGNLIEPSQEAETMEDAATETSAVNRNHAAAARLLPLRYGP